MLSAETGMQRDRNAGARSMIHLLAHISAALDARAGLFSLAGPRQSGGLR